MSESQQIVESAEEGDEAQQLQKENVSFALNILLQEFDMTILNSIDLPVPGAAEEKLDQLLEKLKKFFIKNYKSDSTVDDFQELISLLNEKFHQLQKSADKIHLLTVLPMSWTASKIANAMNCSLHLTREAKLLQSRSGILTRPDPKRSSLRLSEDLKNTIKSFYFKDDISRIMPGKRDCICIKEDGLKIQVQKRLILSNLKEVYVAFKEAYPEVKVGFSKFAEHRPPFCILVGLKGTHCVCVYVPNSPKCEIDGCRSKTK